MKPLANLLFEAAMLKRIARSGFAFLGTGRETVAEHCFMAAFIALTLSEMEPEVDAHRLLAMCLVHDLAEARIGDLNYVQKEYVSADEDQALADATAALPFGSSWRELIAQFNAGQTREALLARDADQIALILDLKALSDSGSPAPRKWLPQVVARVKTATGKALVQAILETDRDAWWLNKFIDRHKQKQ
jgi:putative hydrolase of HD superfamily